MPVESKQLALSIEYRPIEKLIGYVRNARTHSEEQVAQIAASIREFGWTNPVLVDGDNGVIAGHGRILAARKLGIEKVPVIELKHLTPAQKKAYILADNKLSLNAGWDDELLAVELQDLKEANFDLSLTGFSSDEIDDLMEPSAGDGESEEDAAADEVPEVEENPVVQLGDLWILGDHRLLCGDSTNAADIERVMKGEVADLCFTSPPYGQQRDYANGGIEDWDALMNSVFAVLPMSENAQVVVNLGLIHRNTEWQPYWTNWIAWMRTKGWKRFGWYVWDQGPGMPGDWNGRLSPSFEFIFHFCKHGRKPNKIVECKWAGHITDEKGGFRKKDGEVTNWGHAGEGVQEMRIPDSVIRITRHKARGIEVEHPAVFPVKLPSFMMETYTNPSDICFEPFSGSGTSLVAGQKTGRKVRAIELAPVYVDVTLRRWRELFPDINPVLEGDNRTYDEIAAERRKSASS